MHKLFWIQKKTRLLILIVITFAQNYARSENITEPENPVQDTSHTVSDPKNTDESNCEDSDHDTENLIIPGFVHKSEKSNDRMYFKYKYVDANSNIREGFIEITYLEIVEAIKDRYGPKNIYQYRTQLVEILDAIIKSKKAQAYLMHHTILNNDEILRQQIKNDIYNSTKQANTVLFDKYILSLCQDEFKQINPNESQEETLYYFCYVVVNNKKIADSIADFVKTNNLIKKNAKDAFKQAAEQYGSIKKMPTNEDEPITINEIANIFDAETTDEFQSAEEKTVLKPIQLNNNKYIVVFIEQKVQQTRPEEKMIQDAKQKIIQKKSKEIIEAKVKELKPSININRDAYRPTDIVIHIDDPRIQDITLEDLYDTIDDNIIDQLDDKTKQKLTDVMLNLKLAEMIKEIICLDENLQQEFFSDFMIQRAHLLNKKFIQRIQEYSYSITVTDEELTSLYPDEIKRKRIQGCFLSIEHKPLFDNVYTQLLHDINKLGDFAEKQAKFVEISSTYTINNYIKNDFTISNLKKMGEKWFNATGDMVNPENFERGTIYISNVPNLNTILFVVDVYTEELSQQLLDELRKKYANDKMQQMLLCVSMIPIKSE